MKVRSKYTQAECDLSIEFLIKDSAAGSGQIERLEQQVQALQEVIAALITHLNIPDEDVLEILQVNYTYEAVK